MTIHKEGYTSIALCVLFIFILNAVVDFYLPEAHVIKWIVYILSFALFVIILQFFRSPKFAITVNEHEVLCPADGKVVVIEEATETEFLKDKVLAFGCVGKHKRSTEHTSISTNNQKQTTGKADY